MALFDIIIYPIEIIFSILYRTGQHRRSHTTHRVRKIVERKEEKSTHDHINTFSIFQPTNDHSHTQKSQQESFELSGLFWESFSSERLSDMCTCYTQKKAKIKTIECIATRQEMSSHTITSRLEKITLQLNQHN